MLFQQIEHLTGLAWVIQAALVAAGLLLLARACWCAASSPRRAAAWCPTRASRCATCSRCWSSGSRASRASSMGPDWRKYFPIVGTHLLLHPGLEPDGADPRPRGRHQQRQHDLGLGGDRLGRLHGGRDREARVELPGQVHGAELLREGDLRAPHPLPAAGAALPGARDPARPRAHPDARGAACSRTCSRTTPWSRVWITLVPIGDPGDLHGARSGRLRSCRPSCSRCSR